MPDSLEELAASVAALRAAGGRIILGIVGSPGAGKSTLAQALVARLGACAVSVPMDGFHLANAELRRLERHGRKGAQDTFDSGGYVALLQRIRSQSADEIVYAPEFRREIEEPVGSAIPVLPAHQVVVTEGNYLLLDSGHWAAVRAIADQIWFVDVDPRLRLERLIARHMHFGRSELDARDWVSRTDEPNAQLIDATRSRADRVIHLA